ncbi:acetylcholine receptor subunit beta-type unc-29-like [Convolutriloba macropyga]|uniref:acetylcholine receptor subunit beta-type unc-29-like n=1 Tax=Convolutriloba macropyga TaxID=536237 RepID=UPI003F51EF67
MELYATKMTQKLHVSEKKITFSILKILIVVTLCHSSIANDDIPLPAARLRSNLLKNYHSTVRPVRDQGVITGVFFRAWLYELVSIDPKSQTINMLMFQLLQWRDELLKWDPKNYSDLYGIEFDRSEIWSPDVVPYNEVGGFDIKTHDSVIPIYVNKDGDTWWMRPAEYKTTCRLDVTNFPFDTQHCTVIVGSWHYLSNEVMMVCNSCSSCSVCKREVICDSEYLRDNLWSLESKLCSEKTTEGSRGPYSTLIISFTFKRLSSFYVKNLIIPHTLILFLSTLIFFIPGEVGEKIGFGITVTLTIVVNLSIVSEFLPHSSTSYPKLYQFYLSSIVLSGLSLVLSTISVNLVFQEKQIVDEETARHTAEQDVQSAATAPSTNTDLSEIDLRDEPETPSKLNVKIAAAKLRIVNFWKYKLTRRKLDMIIGGVYFMVILLYTAIFFSSLK